VKHEDEDKAHKDVNRNDIMTKGPQEVHDQQNESSKFKHELLAKSIKRFDGYDLAKYKGKLEPYSQTKSLTNFVLFLIAIIEDKKWQQIFESCIPLLKRSTDFLYTILPYLVYYTLRFGPPGNDLSL